jgi:AcrR family transcriptional regulator
VFEVVGKILDSGGDASLWIADISQASGFSIGSIYHHVGSREGVIAAARERRFRESLSSGGQVESERILDSATPNEFIQRFDEALRASEGSEVALERRRRFELMGAAATRPDSLPAVASLESAYLDVGEQIAQESCGPEDGYRSKWHLGAFALFLHSMSMVWVVRELDEAVSAAVAIRCKEGTRGNARADAQDLNPPPRRASRRGLEAVTARTEGGT